MSDNQLPLERYGIRWNSPTEPICTPMIDGYWTPWHVAHAEIEKLKAENERLKAAQEWQPIETAPKDGTQYLAWNGLSYMVLNQPDESFSIGEWELVDGEWVGHHVGHHPTHWQQLRTPPEHTK